MAVMVEPLSQKEVAARRRQRSIALALVLAVFAVIVYVLTIAKLGPGIFDRAL
jgi:hypothetical protein